MATPQDKARKARNLANEAFGGVSGFKTRKLVTQNAKAAGKKLTPAEETRAAKIMQPRRQNDRDRTAARGTFITGPNSPASKRAVAAKISAAVGGLTRKAPTKKAAAAKKKAK
jgi:hypothetical protein